MNLLNADIKHLVKAGVPIYVNRHKARKGMLDAILPGMKSIADDKENESYKVVVEALFQSGFLSPTEHSFNLDMLLQYIYGVMLSHAVEPAEELFDLLVKGGYTSLEESAMYHPLGELQYAAFSYPGNVGSTAGPDILRKVIYMSSQASAWAIVIDLFETTKKPGSMHFIQARGSGEAPNELQELIDMEFAVGDSRRFSAYRTESDTRIITSLSVTSMRCTPVLEPRAIDHVSRLLYDCLTKLKGAENGALITDL